MIRKEARWSWLLLSLAVLTVERRASADGGPAKGAPALKAESTSLGVWPDLGVPSQLPTQPSDDAALIVGVEKYDALPAVRGAAETARDWEKYFLFGRRVAPERVKLLVDQEATHEAIEQRLADLVARTREGGTLWVVFIGHGAPGEAGGKGLLLGADARPSDASFAARSVSYDRLAELAGKGVHARTVMVLDACFSGVSNEGKTLIPSVQPVIATKLVSASKTTVIAAASSAEYAGALPGSQRPAVSYLILGALRGWADDDGDGKVTATEAHAYASLVLRSLPNNHEQHPELVSDDPALVLESEAREKAPDLAVMRSKVSSYRRPTPAKDEPGEIKVAVGCRDPGVRTPDEGLVVFLDGATESASPLGVRMRVEGGREVPAFVPFSVKPGEHRVRVRLPGCEELETTVSVRGGGSAEVFGLLPPSNPFFEGTPAGSPDGLRLGLGLSTSVIEFAGFEKLLQRQPGLGPPPIPTIGFTGPALHGGLQLRWLTAMVDLGAAFGSVTGSLESVATEGSSLRVVSQSNDTSLSLLTAGVRVGARLPLQYVAVSAGPGASGSLLVASPEVGDGSTSGLLRISGWTAVDVQPLCSYGLQLGYSYGLTQSSTSGVDVRQDHGIFVNAAWQPNAVCSRRRDGAYKLEGKW